MDGNIWKHALLHSSNRQAHTRTLFQLVFILTHPGFSRQSPPPPPRKFGPLKRYGELFLSSVKAAGNRSSGSSSGKKKRRRRKCGGSVAELDEMARDVLWYKGDFYLGKPHGSGLVKYKDPLPAAVPTRAAPRIGAAAAAAACTVERTVVGPSPPPPPARRWGGEVKDEGDNGEARRREAAGGEEEEGEEEKEEGGQVGQEEDDQGEEKEEK